MDQAINKMKTDPKIVQAVATELGVDVQYLQDRLVLPRMDLAKALMKLSGKSLTFVVSAFSKYAGNTVRDESPAGGFVKPTRRQGKNYRY